MFFNPAHHGAKPTGVGHPAVNLAEMVGITAPADTVVLIAAMDDTSHDNPRPTRSCAPC